MKTINWLFLLFAVIATITIMGIGISIANRSFVGILGCLFILIMIMATGFKMKRQLKQRHC